VDKSSLDKQRFFFDHYGVTEHDLERYLSAALSAGGDYADLYFEYLSSTSLMVDESMVKSASQGISAGCGVRVVSGERTGYAYTDDLSSERILHAAKTAALIASAPAKEVRASYADELRNILVVGSDGTFAEDSQPLARMNVSCIAKTEGNSARGTSGGGGRVALDFFFGEKTPEFFAKESARQAILQLDAREAPAGEMEVVLGPGWPGVLLHEAVGHGLEADFNRKKTSAFAGLVGKRVASEKCTVVDNGTMPWRRGSLNVDDEGEPTQETVLIENGILKGYLSDKLSSRLMGISDTGNGRRESYEHIPMPRMTNTYMLAGQDDPGDIIRSVKHGIYAVNFGGGQVDITNGKFVFSASEAYMIENGQITAPIKGATLIGNGPDVLTRVSMVGNDLKLDEGVGTCGKDGQAVPVGVGIPTLKIDRLTVGGTARKDPGGFMQ
jgi:TldD protein